MLKIKDDVSKEELKKFKFKYNKRFNIYTRCGRTKYTDDVANYYITEERELQINTEGWDYTLDDFIYDLITAGLVEKIEE